MTSTKTLTLAVLAASLLSATSVFAKDEVSAEDKERAYQIACVPGCEKALSTDDAKSAAEFRAFYQSFLANPAAILPVFEQYKNGGNGISGIGLAIQLAVTCGATDLLRADIEARGCKNEKGAELSISHALEVCAPVIEWVNAQEQK